MLESVRRLRARFTIAHTGIVDDRVVAPEGICLRCNAAHPGDAREVTDNDVFSLRHGRARVGGPRLAAGVQRYGVAGFCEELPRQEAEAVGRPGDEHARHRTLMVAAV